MASRGRTVRLTLLMDGAEGRLPLGVPLVDPLTWARKTWRFPARSRLTLLGVVRT